MILTLPKVDYQSVSCFRSSTAQCWQDIKVPPERAFQASRGMYDNCLHGFVKKEISDLYSGCKQLLQLMAIAMRLKASTSLPITVSMATPRSALSVVTSMLITIL